MEDRERQEHHNRPGQKEGDDRRHNPTTGVVQDEGSAQQDGPATTSARAPGQTPNPKAPLSYVSHQSRCHPNPFPGETETSLRVAAYVRRKNQVRPLDPPEAISVPCGYVSAGVGGWGAV